MSQLQNIRDEVTFDLLSTKLAPPRLSANVVPRKSLLVRLDAGLEKKLTLISAPAGFGKTTLVSEWIAERRQNHNLPQVAWVSLDSGDNDPVRFWRYVLTACQVFGSGFGKSALDLLMKSPQPSFEALLTQFINEVSLLSDKVILVLEDYQFVDARQIHESLAYLIDHFPTPLHLVLMTRSDPPLPLARLRARNELNELRLADLRFTLEETQAFLQQTIPFQLPPEIIARLEERTEGWVTGLRLVSLALQGMKEQAEIERYLTSFTGSHRPILEYLVADVFDAQPEAIQEFLLQTSFLSRLAGPLCDAVTGREDSTLILEQLERLNLFLISLDSAGYWYRYHALFAEAIQHYARKRLRGTVLYELAQKASIWYEENGMLAEAIEASLYAQDELRAADLIERFIAPQLIQNEYLTLRRWLEQLPEAALRPHPNLSLTLAIAILFTSDRYAPDTFALIEPLLQLAEQTWKAEGNRPKLGEVLAARSLANFFQWNLSQSFADARQALERLPEENIQWRGISLIFVGLEELLNGRMNVARQALLQALELCRRAGNFYGVLDTMLLLGRVYMNQGKLHRAAQQYRQALAEIEDTPMDRSMGQIRMGRALIGLSKLNLEWNVLETAEQYAAQAVEIEQSYADEELRIQSVLALARAQHARGQSVQAQQRLQAVMVKTKHALPNSEVKACQARIALDVDDLSTVEEWIATNTLSGDLPRIQQEQEALIIARLRIEQGEAGAAIQDLASWLAEAHDNGRVSSEIEINIILTLANAALGEREMAKETLTQALVLAQPEGYLRIFLDEGEKLVALLKEALPKIRDEPLAAYARALIYMMVQEQAQKPAGKPLDSQLLIEPLSEQERRVLRLIAAGLSNPEIAKELVVSINTVKTHVKNIYAKLNVTNREEARQAARHIKLL